jgi:hypothetical protein
MDSHLNCHNVPKHTEFSEMLLFNVTGNAECFKKERYNGIPNVTVWQVLRKYLCLKAYKLSIFQYLERWIVCTPLNVNSFVTLATQ